MDKMRNNLVELLEGGHAHVTFDRALKRLKPSERNVRPDKDTHSVWELLEHLRLAQEDIYRYTIDPEWKSPKWPEGYWPDPKVNPTEKMWDASIKGFKSDLKGLIDLVKDEKLDIASEIPHGEGRTYLREILLTADHNAYHIGQIVQTRKSLKNW
jgi:DinB superfamily